MKEEEFENTLLGKLKKSDNGYSVLEMFDELIAEKHPALLNINTVDSAKKHVRRKLERLVTLSRFSPVFNKENIRDREIQRLVIDDTVRFIYTPNIPRNQNKNSEYDPDEVGLEISRYLIERFFNFAMPEDIFSAFTHGLYAQDAPIPQKAKKIRECIHVEQRGQQLRYLEGQPSEILDTLYEALIKEKQICIEYLKVVNGEDVFYEKTLSPIGIQYSDPKLYLIATDPKAKIIKQYIIQNIGSISLLNKKTVKDQITLKQWVKDKKPLQPKGLEKATTVKLQVANRENIIRDLKTFKLSYEQEEHILDDGTMVITLKNFDITYSFINWLLSISTSIKVIAPLKLKNHVIKELERSLTNYD